MRPLSERTQKMINTVERALPLLETEGYDELVSDTKELLRWLKANQDIINRIAELEAERDNALLLYDSMTEHAVDTEDERDTARQSRFRLVGLVRARSERGWMTMRGVSWVQKNIINKP